MVSLHHTHLMFFKDYETICKSLLHDSVLLFVFLLVYVLVYQIDLLSFY